MNFILLGTISAGMSSVAVFGLPKGTTTIRLNQEVQGFHLVAVERKGVTLTKGKETFFLTPGDQWDGAAGPIKIETGIERKGDDVRVTASLRDYVVKEGLLTILMQAASEPVLEGGNIIGYKIWDIDPGSVYQLAGIEEGDVVTEIDGVALSSPFTALRQLSGIKTAEKFSFKFMRGGVVHDSKVEVL